ncbi:hypothetical protein BGZ99_008207 [Dissophora globulifera]|uniref:Transmembrane protein 209 n=1 Tax=Dissophora globulifera TaxID=979702 RepID=A0A9P6RA87_9FUNG|nr:hypothetical protein BGZ99_008207 [Dissophora globulifera]
MSEQAQSRSINLQLSRNVPQEDQQLESTTGSRAGRASTLSSRASSGLDDSSVTDQQAGEPSPSVEIVDLEDDDDASDRLMDGKAQETEREADDTQFAEDTASVPHRSGTSSILDRTIAAPTLNEDTPESSHFEDESDVVASSPSPALQANEFGRTIPKPLTAAKIPALPEDSIVESDDEEELINIPINSLSDSTFDRQFNRTGLPTAPINLSLPESANGERWDLLEDQQSDVEMDDAFYARRLRDPPTSSKSRNDAAWRVSPLAPFIPTTSAQIPTPLVQGNTSANVVDVVTSKPTERGINKGVSRDSPFASFLSGDDKSASESEDAVHVGMKIAAAAAGAILTKLALENRDSGVESSSIDEIPERMAHSDTAPELADTSSDDGLVFDDGAGVGVGRIPQAQIPLRRTLQVPEDTNWGASTPRFTTAEKGKQVVRDSHTATRFHDEAGVESSPVVSIGDRQRSPTRLNTSALSQSTRQDRSRAQIYPPAPLEPWNTDTASSRLSQRHPPAASSPPESTSTVGSDEQNLALMSSARKAAPPTVPASVPGVKSLLSDYPDTLPQLASVVAKPVLTLPADPSKAPLLQGRYELPSITKMDEWKSKNSLAPNAFRRLIFNTGALIVTTTVMRARWYRLIVRVVSSFTSPSIFYWAEWGAILLFVFNILEVVYSYSKSSNNFENLPLTPSQRALLGLDPVASKVPGAVPIFKKSASVRLQATAEKPIMSTYISPSPASRAPFQKPAVGLAASEYRDAATILSKSMSRSFNQASVQDKGDLERLMRNVEARDELYAEWKSLDSDASKRPFGLHTGYGAPQSTLQTGVDMAVDNAMRPDLLASLNSRGPIIRYQHALRTTLSKDHTSKADLQQDGLYVVNYGKVLKNLKVSEHQLDKWAFNMRKWMWNNIIRHVCSEMEQVDEELRKENLSYLDCKSATMFYTSVPVPQPTTNASDAATANAAAAPAAPAPLTNSLGWGAASIATTRLPSAFVASQPQQPQMPTSLQDLEARYGQSPVVRRRLVLETYLAIPGYSNRQYVIERLQALGPLLTQFIWNSNGVVWGGGKKAWTPDLPSDAQIVMHMFTAFMDLAMPAQDSQIYNRFPFSYKYYVPVDSKPEPQTLLQIKQSSKMPPNYNLVVEGSIWEVVPKRLNVWYTLALFVYMVMKENGGYLGQLNIDTRSIGLGEVVEGYDA